MNRKYVKHICLTFILSKYNLNEIEPTSKPVDLLFLLLILRLCFL